MAGYTSRTGDKKRKYQIQQPSTFTVANFYFDFTFTVLYNKSNKNQSNTPKNILKMPKADIQE